MNNVYHLQLEWRYKVLDLPNGDRLFPILEKRILEFQSSCGIRCMTVSLKRLCQDIQYVQQSFPLQHQQFQDLKRDRTRSPSHNLEYLPVLRALECCPIPLELKLDYYPLSGDLDI